MEISSSMKETWKKLVLGTIISCLLVLLLLNQKSSISQATLSLLERSAQFGASSYRSTIIGVDHFSPPPTPSNTINYQAQDQAQAQPSIIAEKEKENLKEVIVRNEKQVEDEKSSRKQKCDIFDGRWVYKPEAKASYCVLKCPFIEEKMSCQSNGRPDFEYEKWVWEPTHCDIPMLNGTDMVERFRNKRVVLVGDSLNRNMWESLACILYSSIPYPSINAQVLFESAHIKTFMRAKDDYNFTLEFYWSPYLVEQNKNHSSGKKVLVLDKLSPNSDSWLGADILIFNTGMHWIQVPPKRGWDYFEYDGKLTNTLILQEAYSLAMSTWAKWVQNNIDPKKDQSFLQKHIS